MSVLPSIFGAILYPTTKWSKFSKIYVRITVSLLELIYICRFRENIQQSMLANTNYSNISIDNYKQGRFKTYMLEFTFIIFIECTDM